MGTSSGYSLRLRQLSRPVAAGLLVTGCFQYVPGSYPPAPKPNSEVRVELASPRDIPMGEFTLNEVTVIEGTVAEATEDTLGIWARWIRPRLGRKYDAAGATFYIPRSEIASMDGWRLAPRRTVLAIGVGVAAGALLLGVIGLVGASGTGPGDPGPTTTSTVAPR
ncbi:MAG TPA: hypothetical protein VF970_04575 [Gemmatimonadales bacterium]